MVREVLLVETWQAMSPVRLFSVFTCVFNVCDGVWESCIRDNLLGVQTKSGRGRWALGDDARYVKR